MLWRFRGIAAMALLLVASAADVHAGAVVSGFNSNAFPANDDGSTGLVGIGFTVDFFGVSASSVYVNNNGNVTFTGPLTTFTPFPLVGTSTRIIAPFFADVDTRVPGSSIVSYGTGSFDGRDAFGVNWIDVGYFGSSSPSITNSFQLLLVDRSDVGAGDFDIIFNYDDIRWETGTASGGSSATGRGGSSARAGYSNGVAASFELPGSGLNGRLINSGPFALINGSLNSDVAGRYIFQARNGIVVEPSTVPEPASLLLFGMGGGALLTVRTQKRRRTEQSAA